MRVRFKKKIIDIAMPPFRGILSEIAREECVTRQAIQQSARNGNAYILARIAKKIEERKDSAVMTQRISVYEDLAKKQKKKGRKAREPRISYSWSIASQWRHDTIV